LFIADVAVTAQAREDAVFRTATKLVQLSVMAQDKQGKSCIGSLKKEITEVRFN
jgi:hypothetical protein